MYLYRAISYLHPDLPYDDRHYSLCTCYRSACETRCLVPRRSKKYARMSAHCCCPDSFLTTPRNIPWPVWRKDNIGKLIGHGGVGSNALPLIPSNEIEVRRQVIKEVRGMDEVRDYHAGNHPESEVVPYQDGGKRKVIIARRSSTSKSTVWKKSTVELHLFRPRYYIPLVTLA